LLTFDDALQIINCEGEILCGGPCENVYEFQGVFTLNGYKEPLNLDNVIWANSILATDKLLGLVLYTGKETRSALNNK